MSPWGGRKTKVSWYLAAGVTKERIQADQRPWLILRSLLSLGEVQTSAPASASEHSGILARLLWPADLGPRRWEIPLHHRPPARATLTPRAQGPQLPVTCSPEFWTAKTPDNIPHEPAGSGG